MRRFFQSVLYKELAIFLLILFLSGCSKNDTVTNVQPPPPPPPDSVLVITALNQLDLNEFDCFYTIDPKSYQKLDKVYLRLSRDSGGIQTKKDILLQSDVTGKQSLKYMLMELGQKSSYAAELISFADGDSIFSNIKTFKVDELKITACLSYSAGYFPIFTSRPYMDAVISTNFSYSQGSAGTHVYMNDIECAVTVDEGSVIAFNIDENVLPGRYQIKLVRKGLTTTTPKDSIIILRGMWHDLGNMPVEKSLYGDEGFIIDYGVCQMGTDSYVLGGNYLDATNPRTGYEGMPEYVKKYNLLDNTWSRIYPKEMHWLYAPLMFGYNNLIYIVAGEEENSTHETEDMISHVHVFNLDTRTFSLKAAIPIVDRRNAGGFFINNKYYLMLGGTLNVRYNDVWEYDPALDQWTRKGDFPGAPRIRFASFTMDGYAYIFGGKLLDGSYYPNYSDELWRYDPSSDTWEKISLVDGPPAAEKYCVFAYNHKAYFTYGQYQTFLGSYYGFVTTSNPYLEWDPQTNEFTRIAFPVNGGNHFSGVLGQNENKVITLGGPFGYFQGFSKQVMEFTVE